MNSNQIHGLRVKFRAEFTEIDSTLEMIDSEIDFGAIFRFSSKNYSNPENFIFYIIDLRFLGEHHTGVLLI